MEIFIYIIAAICIIVGIIGSILPALPGPPFAYLGILLLHFFTPVSFTTSQLLMMLLVVAVVQILDYFIPMFGSKFIGGSSHGTRGCIAGTIIGMFFLPIGILLGPFIGAVIGEMIGGKNISKALVSGIGAFLGFLTGVLLKLVLCGYFMYKYIEVVFF